MVLVKSEDCLYFEEVYTYTGENDCSQETFSCQINHLQMEQLANLH